MIPTLIDIVRGLLNGTMTHEEADRYLLAHLELQAEADELQVDSYERARSLCDIIKRCNEQDQRWGERTYPSFNPAMVASADTSIAGLANTHGQLTPEKARWLREVRAGDNELSWMDILSCEVAKLCERYEDQVKLRDQLLDVAAVAVQWAAALTVAEDTAERPQAVNRAEAYHDGPES